MMKEEPPLPTNETNLLDADLEDHLRRLCLFRRHISVMMQVHTPRTAMWYSLVHIRNSLDRYQSIYTGDVSHYALLDDPSPNSFCPAND